MSATLAVDPKKYARLANRIVVKAIDTEEEYDHMVAAVRSACPLRSPHSWKPWRYWSRLTMIGIILCLRLLPTKCWPT
jgi:hypothetical protein